MSDFAPGDLVIRVGQPLWAVEAAPPLRKVVRVDETECSEGVPGLVFHAYPSPHYSRAWRASHFRKLNDGTDDAELIERIKQCKPVREGLPA